MQQLLIAIGELYVQNMALRAKIAELQAQTEKKEVSNGDSNL